MQKIIFKDVQAINFIKVKELVYRDDSYGKKIGRKIRIILLDNQGMETTIGASSYKNGWTNFLSIRIC